MGFEGIDVIRTGLAYLIAAITPACLVAQDDPGAATAKTRVSLLMEYEALVPGRVNYLGVRLQMAPGWHVYFDGLNDSGLPLQARWTAPEGVEIGKIVWPAPKRKVVGDFILDHVYEREVLLLVPVRVDAGLAGSRVEVGGELSWMVCDDICLMESDEVSVVAGVAAAGAQPGTSKSRELFERSRRRLPNPAEPADDKDVRVVVDGGELIVTAKGADRIVFYPGPECSRPADLISDGVCNGSRMVVRFDAAPERVEGLIEIKRGGSSRFVRVRYPREPGEPGEAGISADR